MLWIRNGKIIMKDGKLIDCDECPCGDQCFEIVLVGTDVHAYGTEMNSRHTFGIDTNLAEIYDITAYDGDNTEVTVRSISYTGGSISLVFVNKGSGGAPCYEEQCENTFNVVIKLKAKPNGRFQIEHIDHSYSGCASSTYNASAGRADCCDLEKRCVYGGGMEHIGTPAEYPTRLLCTIEAKPYVQNVYAVGHVDDKLQWVVGGIQGGESATGNHDVDGLLFSVQAGENASVSVVDLSNDLQGTNDTVSEWFGFDGYIVITKDGCDSRLPKRPWFPSDYDYGRTYTWDTSNLGCAHEDDEDEFE